MAGVVRGRLSAVTYKLFSGFNNCRSGRLHFHTSAFLNVIGQEIKMPSLSPTMAEGTIVKWLKKEGDTIAPGDVLCEIQTDKAVMSFETEEEGILAKILMADETKDIKVGTTIALMVGEGEDWQNVDAPSGGKQDIPVETTTVTGGSTPGTSVHMPSLSPTMSEGTIIKWHKKEGDTVSPGDVLCDIQTDKAVMSFETEEEGILAKILVPDGTSEVKVGTLIALMVSEGEDWKDVAVPSSSAPVSAAATKPEVAKPAAEPKDSHHAQNYGPAVRGLLELYQLNPGQINPSGRNDKILKSDVLSFIATNNLKPKQPKPVPLPGSKLTEEQATETKVPTKQRTKSQKYVDIELSSMRKTIAKRLTESKTNIPHAYGTFESDIDQVLSFRKQLKISGIAVSVNDFVIKAVALALKQCPLVNCLYHNDQVVQTGTVDISVAVATDSGLITPIVKSADIKGIDEISNEVKQLASKARQGKLQLHEFQGGTFTISNLGMFGISEFSAIINPPQCGILAVGGGRSVLDITGKPVTRMTATLSYDARAISESAAADFLETIQLLLQSPASLLMNSIPQKKAAVST